jgi:hypothetical protein
MKHVDENGRVTFTEVEKMCQTHWQNLRDGGSYNRVEQGEVATYTLAEGFEVRRNGEEFSALTLADMIAADQEALHANTHGDLPNYEISVAQAAFVLELSEVRVRRMVKEGKLSYASRGHVFLTDVMKLTIRWAAGNARTGKADEDQD